MTNSQILDAINQNIKRNENKEITGVILNSVLRMLLDFVNQGFITFSDIIQLLADSKAINVIGSINTTTETTSLPSGVYHAQTSGTYTNASNIVVKEGYYTLLRKKDDGSWALESETKIDLTETNNKISQIETKVNNNEKKVDDFIRDFTVTTDDEFDINSKNPIANKIVAPLNEILKDFKIKNQIDDGTVLNSYNNTNSNFGVLKSTGQVNSSIYTKVIEVDLNNADEVSLYMRPFGSTDQIANSQFVAFDEDGVAESLLAPSQNEAVEYTTYNIQLSKNYVRGIVCYGVYWNSDDSLMKIDVISDIKTIEETINAKDYVDNLKKPLLDFYLKEDKKYDKSNSVQGVLLADGNIQDLGTNIYNKVVEVDLTDVFKVDIKKRPFNSTANGYAQIVAINSNNIASVLLEPNPTESSNYENYTFNFDGSYKKLLVCYTVYWNPDEKDFFVQTYKMTDDVEVNSVTEFILNRTSDSFNPYSKDLVRYFAYPTSIARLDLEGILPTDYSENRLPTRMKAKLYENNTLLMSCPVKMSIQGTSSANPFWKKKNYSIGFYNDDYSKSVEFRIGSWEAGDGFHLKGYASDGTISRDVGSARLWKHMRTSNNYPSNQIAPVTFIDGSNYLSKSNSYDGANFYTDGFPVAIYLNGSFFGVYMWRQKKSAKNYKLDDSLNTHIFLANSTTNLNWNTFDYTQWELKSPKIKGYKEQQPITNAVALASINRLWAWFDGLSKGTIDFESTYADYIDVNSFVDGIIHPILIHHWDYFINNMMLVTYDGNIWQLMPYDMDFTIGRVSTFMSFTDDPNQIIIDSIFWKNTMYPKLLSRIKTRWQELRTKQILTENKIESIYGGLMRIVGREYYKLDAEMWTPLESDTAKDSLKYLVNFLHKKMTYLDTVWRV